MMGNNRNSSQGKRWGQRLVMAFLISALLLFACQPKSNETTMPTIVPTKEQATAEPTLVPTQPPQPPKILTICTAEEPASLYIHNGNNAVSKWNILEAIYDGPIDKVGQELVPVILQSIPTYENGGLIFEPIAVKAGTEVIDAHGELHVVQKGIFVRPAGCHETSCAIEWDGERELLMDSMLLRFELIEGLRWSDGTPLLAADSVFSYQLAADPATPSSNWATDRTSSYQALDERTIEWRGLPGFATTQVDRFFWSPLPQHVLQGVTAADMLTNEAANRQPLGWGAWQIDGWQVGRSIRLVKNPNYFRSSEGLPYFDELIYRFIPDADEALAALQEGNCDLLDSSYGLGGQLEEIKALSEEGKLNYSVRLSGQWQGVTFGINPASYDNGYTPEYGDRPDFFSDGRVRQAFAYCIDRQRIVDELTSGISRVPEGLISGLETQPTDKFDPERGLSLLKEVGWQDADGDPSTPLVSWQVPGLNMGVPFEVSLHSGQSAFDMAAAAIIAESLAQCGILVKHVPLPLEELYAPGPDGVLFGRQFDLALFSWGAEGVELCNVYLSHGIPRADNWWIGANLGGFHSDAFDTTCWDASLSYSLDQPYSQTLQAQFLSELPTIPIVNTLRVIAENPAINMQAPALFSRSDWIVIEEIGELRDD